MLYTHEGKKKKNTEWMEKRTFLIFRYIHFIFKN